MPQLSCEVAVVKKDHEYAQGCCQPRDGWASFTASPAGTSDARGGGGGWGGAFGVPTYKHHHSKDRGHLR